MRQFLRICDPLFVGLGVIGGFDLICLDQLGPVRLVPIGGFDLICLDLWVPKTVSWLVRRHFGTR